MPPPSASTGRTVRSHGCCRRSTRPDWITADLLAQAEHGADAQALLVTTSAALAASVERELRDQTATLPRRAIVETSLASGSIIIVPDMETAIEIVNRYAPEHLILHDNDAENRLPQILHAGSVFLGGYSPETAGDYASGANHVLPTAGFARAYGGITVFSFLKSMTVQKLNPEGLRALRQRLWRWLRPKDCGRMPMPLPSGWKRHELA